MLSHPDPQVQYIFATLEAQRDNLMVENGNQAAEIKRLAVTLAELVPVVEAEESVDAESAPANQRYS